MQNIQRDTERAVLQVAFWWFTGIPSLIGSLLMIAIDAYLWAVGIPMLAIVVYVWCFHDRRDGDSESAK